MDLPGSSRRRQAASRSTLARRAELAATAADVSATSSSSTGPFSRTSRRPAQGAGLGDLAGLVSGRATVWMGAARGHRRGAGWAVAELARPRRTDIRVFDPDDVARLETAMWRSYYDRRRLPLFGQLVALLQGSSTSSRCGRWPWPAWPPGRRRSSRWARATTTTGAPSPTWSATTPASGPSARSPSTRGGRPGWSWSGGSCTASTSCTPPGDLERALADLAAELYQVPAERLWAHASRRAEAMTIRDHAATREVGVLEDDWDRIEAVLWVAWKALADEVRVLRQEEAQEACRPPGGDHRDAAPGQVAGDEQQPRDHRDHGRHRGGDGRAEQQQEGGLADPGPGRDDQQQGPLTKAAANAPVHCSHSSAPPPAPSVRASR